MSSGDGGDEGGGEGDGGPTSAERCALAAAFLRASAANGRFDQRALADLWCVRDRRCVPLRRAHALALTHSPQ